MQMRVGLNSGEVVVRAIGNDLHMDYSAVGRTTHLAARMEQLASPDSSLLTAAMLRLVEAVREAAAKDSAAFNHAAKELRRGGESFATAAPEPVVS
jgi:class 3 adenylate cyclase